MSFPRQDWKLLTDILSASVTRLTVKPQDNDPSKDIIQQDYLEAIKDMNDITARMRNPLLTYLAHSDMKFRAPMIYAVYRQTSLLQPSMFMGKPELRLKFDKYLHLPQKAYEELHSFIAKFNQVCPPGQDMFILSQDTLGYEWQSQTLRRHKNKAKTLEKPLALDSVRDDVMDEIDEVATNLVTWSQKHAPRLAIEENCDGRLPRLTIHFCNKFYSSDEENLLLMD
jgi:hypothetical protein